MIELVILRKRHVRSRFITTGYVLYCDNKMIQSRDGTPSYRYSQLYTPDPVHRIYMALLQCESQPLPSSPEGPATVIESNRKVWCRRRC
jgi:hypothetical protein